MKFDEYSEYEAAKAAGTMRLVRIAGALFVVDTRKGEAKLLKLDEAELPRVRQEAQVARQSAARRMQTIDLLIADAAAAPSV